MIRFGAERGARFWAPIARRALAGLSHGRLTLVDGDRRDTFGGTGRADLAATVTIVVSRIMIRLRPSMPREKFRRHSALIGNEVT